MRESWSANLRYGSQTSCNSPLSKDSYRCVWDAINGKCTRVCTTYGTNESQCNGDLNCQFQTNATLVADRTCYRRCNYQFPDQTACVSTAKRCR